MSTTTTTTSTNKKRSRTDDNEDSEDIDYRLRFDPNAYNDEGDARFAILKKLKKGTMVYKRAEELLTLFDSTTYGTCFYGSLRSFAARDPNKNNPDYVNDKIKVLMVLQEALVSRLLEGLKWRMIDHRAGVSSSVDESVKRQPYNSHIPFCVVEEKLEHIRYLEHSRHLHVYRCFRRDLIDDLIQLYKNLEPGALGPKHVEGTDTLEVVKENNPLLQQIINKFVIHTILHDKCLLKQGNEEEEDNKRLNWCQSSGAYYDVKNEKEDDDDVDNE